MNPPADRLVILTPEAADRVRALLQTRHDGGSGLRVVVEPGGCSGLRYVVSFDRAKDDDILVESHGISILLDHESEPLLRGAVIDFHEAGFSVRNPNARGACACGASFAPRPRVGGSESPSVAAYAARPDTPQLNL